MGTDKAGALTTEVENVTEYTSFNVDLTESVLPRDLFDIFCHISFHPCSSKNQL